MLANAGYTETQIQTLGGGPSRFSIQAGQSYISRDVLGRSSLRAGRLALPAESHHEPGAALRNPDFDRRSPGFGAALGFAWAPGTAKNGRQKTVVRGGFGIFYDRVSMGLFENAALNNGINQVDYTVYNPTFYPNHSARSPP